MKGRLPFAVMLVGSLTFLVSLYFPWLHVTTCFNKFQCFTSRNPVLATFGWGGFGQIAAVLALALAAGTVAAVVDRPLATRLPLGWTAIALGIFALLSTAELWTSAILNDAFPQWDRAGLAPAAYLGLAGAGVAGAGAAAARWGAITRPRSVTSAAGTVITLALIASFALPALNPSFDQTYDLAPDISVFACLGLLAWHGRRPGPRLATSTATGVLVAAQLLPLRHTSARWPYEFWLLLASAAGLLLLALVGSRAIRIGRPAAQEFLIIAASVLLLVSLFLPWQSICQGRQCSVERGWSRADLAGLFALGLLLVLVSARRFVRELAVGAALFVLMTGLAIATVDFSALDVPRHGPPPTSSFESGALLGFAAAALLVVVALGRPRPIPNKRFLVRLAPWLAALGLLFVEMAPNVLNLGDIVNKTRLFALQSPFVTLGWLGALAVLLTLRLVHVWLDRAGDRTELVRLPLALLALSALTVIHDAVVTTLGSLGVAYGKGISWEGWVTLFLCLLLVAFAWIGRRRVYPARTDGSASTTSLATSP